MIEPTDADAGRRVVYRTRPGAVAERGVLRDWNREFCFVVYGPDLHARATRREDLQWMDEHDHAQGQRDAARLLEMLRNSGKPSLMLAAQRGLAVHKSEAYRLGFHQEIVNAVARAERLRQGDDDVAQG